MDAKQLSWKKSIKRFQAIFLVLIILVFYVWSNVLDLYNQNQSKIKELDKVTMSVKKVQDDISIVEDRTSKLSSINKNKTSFIKSYNKCYNSYVWARYDISNKNRSSSLKTCIAWIYPKAWDLKSFKDEDLENIWVSFWVHKLASTWNQSKMNFDQKRVLYSLDRNVFVDRLESFASMLSFSNPVLIDSKLNLYKVSFTITTNLNFKAFAEVLRKLQNEIFTTWNLYYTISNISKFDIMKEDEIQKINIQWNFYFTR